MAKVDGCDYSRIDAAYLADKTHPGTDTGWYNGDFNYDGVINGSDYTLIDNAFNTQGAQLDSEIAIPTVQIAAASGMSSVPEPNAVSLLVTAAIGLVRRRNRHQRRSSNGVDPDACDSCKADRTEHLPATLTVASLAPGRYH